MSDEIERAQGSGDVAAEMPAGGAVAEGPDPGTRSAPVAGPLTPDDLARVAEIKNSVDVSDAQSVLSYGLPAQSRIANFADSLLGDVRNKEAGAGGVALTDLLKKVRELDVDALGGGSGVARIPILGKFANTFDRFATRYQKVATSIDRIVDALERARMALLKDMTVLDRCTSSTSTTSRSSTCTSPLGSRRWRSCIGTRSRRWRPRWPPATTSWRRSG